MYLGEELTRELLLLLERAADGVTVAQVASAIWADRPRRPKQRSAAGALLAVLRRSDLAATVGRGRFARHVITAEGRAYLEECRRELRAAGG